MLIRAYRITDRVGIAVLKTSTGFSTFLMENINLIRNFAQSGIGGLLGFLFTIIIILLNGVRWLAERIGALLMAITNIAFRLTGRTATGAAIAAGGTMARRSNQARARAEIDKTITEDPLRRQNRQLSVIIVLVLGVLIALVIWATSGRSEDAPLTASSNTLGLAVNPTIAPEEEQPVSLGLPTAVSTATELPAVLQARGTIAYVVRENGQDNIWAASVDNATSIRLTNDPADERDPAWSPDGTRLAYASNKGGNWDIYIYDLLSGEEARMTFGLGFEGGPRWSPNGEYLVYESYQETTHLDIFIMSADGSPLSQPRVPGSSATADFSPTWSPDGSSIAFVSWRDNNKDIYIFTLADSSVYNLTNTPNRAEEFPVWSADSKTIAYSGVEGGREIVYIQDISPNSVSQPYRQGRSPTWSPDGSSIAFATDTSTGTLITVAPYGETGATTEIISAPLGAQHPDWTSTTLPPALVNRGGLPLDDENPLYVEQGGLGSGDPPYNLLPVLNVNGADNPLLSEQVNDSFDALRSAVNDAVGRDFLGRLTDMFWDLEYRPQLGEERRNWHMTGRAFSFNRNLIVGFPPPIEIIREEADLATYWRVYVRVDEAAQNGQRGEPLRDMPWDFERETVESYERGGSLRAEMPKGYYVDLTQLAADYGWQRAPASSDWRNNFDGRNYWTFQKREGLAWYDAMREIYPASQLGGFNPTPTPLPTVTPEVETEVPNE